MTWTSLPARIDAYPTHDIGGFSVRAGRPLPFGATPVPGGVNFSVYSNNATAMTLVLFRAGEDEPLAELRFDESFRIGGVYAMTVFGLDPETTAYAYRADGPFAPGEGDRFDRRALLVDPYATALSGRERWRCGREKPWRSRITPADFDWEGDQPLRIPPEDLVVYEAHVRGFTAHPSAGVAAPGTFAGLVAKIPYLVELGVNCVELMPVFEFDERDNARTDPRTGEPLVNYWGYSTVGFFAPKAGYAATGKHGMQVDEFKETVKQLHRAGIEVMLDVVFNHTAEGNELGPTLSLRGLDNRTYYMLTPDGHYFNFSGTGNTLNCNHPVVRGFVLDCLRHWASEFHIDGFRFDLAAILGRSTEGIPLANPPLLEALAHDPVLRDCKLVAEVWDAGGLFQVGSFPDYCRWSEWNAGYRDALRHFLKGDVGCVAELATRFVGSPDLYARRGATASVNFVTAHDGFTLRDLVSYNGKHNEANGEDGRDGENHNISWNCGHEGEGADGPVSRLRERQVRNALLLLLTSHGIPMLLAGDEAGRTQGGNNNAYCHDDELSWFDWTLVERHADLVRFTRHLIAFRKAHPCLRRRRQPAGHTHGLLFPDVSWHGVRPWTPDWSPHSRVFAAMLCARHDDGADDCVYVAANTHWEPHELWLPELPPGLSWHRFADTGATPGADSHAPGAEPPLPRQDSIRLAPRSAAVLLARPGPAATRPHEE
ncbi:glycogen debranching protein GlgX [Amycolatopsis sp. OK19-0408]|uniref:Glycogen debranching protein GlgX n=1 Tax=Amycolatopsis iheyensis TaxID=2945988 RepID=A0A9X2SM45_9PSEU|nr:glycogen debranching protein GlgX [Amycolatopsis iheyensis]MCR6487402.1 glycogen debranching protein GlgX [Amycolatopsis iheyensis]